MGKRPLQAIPALSFAALALLSALVAVSSGCSGCQDGTGANVTPGVNAITNSGNDPNGSHAPDQTPPVDDKPDGLPIADTSKDNKPGAPVAAVPPRPTKSLLEKALAERAVRSLRAQRRYPVPLPGLKPIDPPDSVTVIVRDLQGYSDDCACSGEAIGGITRVTGLMPEVPLALPKAAAAPKRTFVFVGRLLLPDVRNMAESLKTIVFSQARGRVLVTAQIFQALPTVIWIADPEELEDLDAAGIVWDELRPFRQDPATETTFEGMKLRFPSPPTAVPVNQPGNQLPVDSDSSASPTPSLPPKGLYTIDLIHHSPVDPNHGITRITLPHIGDRARNVLVIPRWNFGKDASVAPVLDETFGRQFSQVRQKPADVMVNSAIRRFGQFRDAGNPLATWWLERIVRGASEDPWVRTVVDWAEYDVGHLDIPQGFEKHDVVSPMMREWESCATCHPKAFEAWKMTRHVRAWQTLFNAGKHVDARCVLCHAQEVAPKGGKLSTIPPHRGITCMTCHKEGEKASSRCTTCHNDLTDPKQHWKPYHTSICPGDTSVPAAIPAGVARTCDRMKHVGTAGNDAPPEEKPDTPSPPDPTK